MAESQSLESRVSHLEAVVAGLQQEIKKQPSADKKDWLDSISGTFANCPEFDEVIRLGREWRQSQRVEDEQWESDE